MYDDTTHADDTEEFAYSLHRHLAYRMETLRRMREEGMPEIIVAEQHRMVRAAMAKVLAEARRPSA